MTSGGREALKWLAVVLMTGDHVAKVFFGGYVPVVSELGRIAFPVFALVMAYNLAQPGADVGKSVRRLLVWGIVAQPAHALVFGYWIPLNVLLSFALATAALWCVQQRRWWLLGLCLGPSPLLVDYQWAGVALVLSGYWWHRRQGEGETFGVLLLALCGLCVYNGNGWALIALPAMALGKLGWRVPRTRWGFYGYYVGHLALLGAYATWGWHMDPVMIIGWTVVACLLLACANLAWRIFKARRMLRHFERRVRKRGKFQA